MKNLNEDLKTGQLKQVYLLYGTEAYLRKQYKNRLKAAILPEGDTMNVSYFEGKHQDIRQLIDLAETLPFFAERRLIILENTGLFQSAGAELADYIKTMPEYLYLIFVEEDVDKRSKLYKAVKARGYAAELSAQDAAVLKRWVRGLLGREKKQMSDADIVYLISKTGTDMENLLQEIEKLVCYCMDKTEIRREDIDAVCITQTVNHIFDMVSAVAEKNQKRALTLYYDLLALKEPPMRILFLMARQYRLLFQVKALADQGYAKKEIASKAGLHPFVAGKYMEQSRRFRMKELREAMEESADLEQRVKTGMMTDQLAVELFLVQQSST